MNIKKLDKKEISDVLVKEVTDVVRKAFGSEMTYDDVCNHLKEPDETYIIFDKNEKIKGMACYSNKDLIIGDCLYVDGIALSPDIQGKGIFNIMTSICLKDKPTIHLVGLRTQNPNMYQALKNYTDEISPHSKDDGLNIAKRLLAKEMDVDINKQGVIKNCYGKSLYTKIPKENPDFKKLRLNYDKGDSVICVGYIRTFN